MYRFIQFNDEKIDSMIYMQLSDLTQTLMESTEIQLVFGVHSYLDLYEKKVFVRHFWNHRSNKDMLHGFKSDVYLRAIGNYHYTTMAEMFRYAKSISNSPVVLFARQLFMLAEDIRVEERCKVERPGTKQSFATRRTLYRDYFYTQRKANLVKSVYTDALFNTMYLLLTTDSPLEEIPAISPEIDRAMPYIEQSLRSFFDSKTTKEVADKCIEMIEVLEEILPSDMLNEYFHLPEKQIVSLFEDQHFNELKRLDAIDIRVSDEKEKNDQSITSEHMPMWHSETKDVNKSLLQSDLEKGAQDHLLGEGVREGDGEEDAMFVTKGHSSKSTLNDYSKIDFNQQLQTSSDKQQSSYGKDNSFAVAHFIEKQEVMSSHILQYQQCKLAIESYQKKLKSMIDKFLEHKRYQPSMPKVFGRLSSNLIPYFVEENPNLFYKKQEPSKEIDAAFTLLVDCSASMFDKMDETKLGITLFHEALKSLFVPHEVIGFWEDTSEASKSKQPNYFQVSISYKDSVKQEAGPSIMTLQPQEDNRDGFAIRKITERILERKEKQKFLLVFSDGEPAAFDYEQNGIVDTHEAVLHARKNGIEVMNVFLSHQQLHESQRKLLQDIYGNYSLVCSSIEELPDLLFPLLKKLLYKSI